MANIKTLAGFLIWNAPGDVNDANQAQSFPVFVQIERQGNTGGSLEFRVNSVPGATATIGGTPANTNTVTLTVNGIATLYTIPSSLTTAQVATNLAAALNANAAFADNFTAAANGSTVVVTANEPGEAEDVAVSVSATGGGATIALPAGQTALVPTNPLTALTNNSSCSVVITQP